MPQGCDGADDQEFGWYLYGVVAWSENDGQSRERIQIDEDLEVRIIAEGGLGAIVGKVPLTEFGEAALEENLQNISWLEEKVCLHQTVLQKVMTKRTIVPMKFGVIFRTPERVRETLTEQRGRFRALLKMLHGYAELGVKGYYRQEELHKYLLASGESKKSGQAASGSGTSYLLRKKLEEDVSRRAGDYSSEIGEQVYSILKSHSSQACIHKLLSKQATGRAEELFFNGAFLVDVQTENNFRQVVEKFNSEFLSRGIFFEVSGPWPAYSFGETQDAEE